MNEFFLHIVRTSLVMLAAIVGRLLLDITITGKENVPQSQSLIVVSNHFSWFDAPLLTTFLPFQPAFLVATESQSRWPVRLFIHLFNGIPIWRGQVDRQALRRALNVLKRGGVLGIFPEGGIDPSIAHRVARGQRIENISNHYARESAQLARPRPGIALLAVKSQARLLPVGLIGTEKILQSLRNFKRPAITLRIGPAFGPVTADSQLHGRDRREQLDLLADQIMQHIAALFPPENRGPYRHEPLKVLETA
jgi:1-acyl-sn-glycerol-3-phosphate acyltransferase